MKLIKGIILLLNFFVIALTALAYISPHIDPMKIWVFSFFGLVFPLLLFLNIAFLIIWFIIDKKKMFWSIIILLIGYNSIKKTISIHFDDKDANMGLTVLSFNMNQGAYLYKKKIKKGLFGDYVKSQNADIILGQEINSKRIRNEMDSLYRYVKIEKNIGTGIFSKYPIVNSGQVDFQLNTNSCVWADIVVRKDTFRVYSVHFMSNQISKQATDLATDFGNEEDVDTKKVREVLSRYKKYVQVRARQVKKVKKHVEKSPYPVILGGDFNDPSISFTYQQISELLKDAFVEKGLGMGVSYGGPIPFLRIDNIFVSDKIDVMSFKKLDDKFSDHFAVKAKLDI